MGASRDIETVTIRKLSWRLIPFLMICYCAAYIDRVNVGFAGLTMNQDLGFTATIFGTGAGLFFLGYVLFEVPSNLVLYRFGARKSLARIMICWGLLAVCSAFVTGERSFYAVRFLLGAAEAGFFPGVLFYLTLWFPKAYRGRIVSSFMASIPISVVIGAPLSGVILRYGGILGLDGWQSLFLVEGLPSIVLGILVPILLSDRPADARWLSAEEKQWLNARLASETTKPKAKEFSLIIRALTDWTTLAYSLAYFALITCTVGISFWLPQIVKSMGMDNLQTSGITAIPSVAALAGMILIGRSSDRTKERRLHCAIGFGLGAVGLICTAFVASPAWQIVGFSVAAFGLQGSQPIFWTIPSSTVTGSAAAASFALINSIGSLAGFWGPWIIGVVKDATGSFDGGMIVLAGFGLLAAGLVSLVARTRTGPDSAKSVGATSVTRSDPP